jgi:hypothetical protein
MPDCVLASKDERSRNLDNSKIRSSATVERKLAERAGFCCIAAMPAQPAPKYRFGGRGIL